MIKKILVHESFIGSCHASPKLLSGVTMVFSSLPQGVEGSLSGSKE